MSALQDAMMEVASDLSQDQGLPADVVGAGDFLNWLMELAKELIPLIIGCFASTEKAVAAMNNPNIFQRFRLRAFMRRQMNDNAFEARYLEPVTRSFLKIAKTMTQEKWSAIIAA